MKETVILMRFLRHDPVGQRFGVGVLVIAWLAVAWTSLGFARRRSGRCWQSPRSSAAAAKKRPTPSTTSKISTS